MLVTNEEVLRRLNPFVFRAYYCDHDEKNHLHPGQVSIPLFSGRITADFARGVFDRFHVSIPLFSGRITATWCEQHPVSAIGLNPFVFRAYYCVEGSTKIETSPAVSIPLFSGRITATVLEPIIKGRARLNPFVFRAYYCGKETYEKRRSGRSQSLCFQGVLLRDF